MNELRNSLTLGTFDGVHIGHRRLISKTLDSVNENGKSIVLTFHYPAMFYLNAGIRGRKTFKPGERAFSSENYSGLIYTPERKAAILKGLGIDDIYFLDFLELKNATPCEFVENIVTTYQPSTITVGFNFSFGRDKTGNVNLLARLGSRYGFKTIVVPPVLYSGHRVSSSLIRFFIRNGDIGHANELLKRPFSIEGSVYRDQGLGRKLGFPTANIKRDGIENSAEKDLNDKAGMIVPAFGVYLVYTPGVGYGLMNVGTRPTVKDGSENIHYEVHYLDSKPELYNEEIVCFVLEYMREERQYNSFEALSEAIAYDKHLAAKLITKWEKDGWWEDEL